MKEKCSVLINLIYLNKGPGPSYTDKKEKKIFLICKEIHIKGAVAKSDMTPHMW
jgi:hypothetical protein